MGGISYLPPAFIDRTSLWKVPAASSGEPERLPFAGGEASWPAISRSGNRLAYEREVSDGNIWRLPLSGLGMAAGPPVRLIHSTRADSSPQYSPDGKRIVFESFRSGVHGTWISDADGSNAVELLQRPGAICGTARWSPDGQRVAFEYGPAGNMDIYVIRASGGKPIRLTTDSADDVGPKLVQRWQLGLLWIEADGSMGGVEGTGGRRKDRPGDP